MVEVIFIEKKIVAACHADAQMRDSVNLGASVKVELGWNCNLHFWLLEMAHQNEGIYFFLGFFVHAN